MQFYLRNKYIFKKLVFKKSSDFFHINAPLNAEPHDTAASDKQHRRNLQSS